MSPEARWTLNGAELSTGQAMAVRVAITQFALEMTNPDALGTDAHGRHMTQLYRERLREVIAFMKVPT